MNKSLDQIKCDKIYHVIAISITSAPVVEINCDSITAYPKLITAKGSESDSHFTQQELEDFKENIKYGELINPIIIVKYKDSNVVVSGHKRLQANRNAFKDTIKCKKLDYESLLTEASNSTPNMADLTSEEQEEIIFSLLSSISFTESILTNKPSDKTVITLFSRIRTAFNLQQQEEDFAQVMPILGITSKSKSYRNMLRLWAIACNDLALNLIKTNFVTITFLKKDKNLKYLENKQKQKEIYDGIINYCKDLKDTPNDKVKDVYFKYIDYSEHEIEELMSSIFYSQNSSNSPAQNAIDIKLSKLKIKQSDKQIRIPSISINLDNSSEENFGKIIDVVFNLKNTVEVLERYIKNNQPTNAGESKQNIQNELSFIKHDAKKYYEFIKKLNLQQYANIQTITKFASKLPADKNFMPEDEKVKNLRHSDKIKIYKEAFITWTKAGEKVVNQESDEMREAFGDKPLVHKAT